MDSIVINGGRRLEGKIRIAGAKNSSLALMPLSLLTEDKLQLCNVPMLSDIDMMSRLLVTLGCKIELDRDSRCMSLQTSGNPGHFAEYDIVRKMRASFLVLGPLLARTGQARVSLPGGCAIGARGVDLHLLALRKLGARITLRDGYVNAVARNGLKGSRIEFPVVSVGATENTMMAAVLARGTTVIGNAAMEPEVSDLAHCLCSMGAHIEGIGTHDLTIHGVEKLKGCRHEVVQDRIELGTYMLAAAITGGSIEFAGADAGNVASLIELMERMGVEIVNTSGGMLANGMKGRLKPVAVETAPYPGFPTDLQAQLMATMTLATGDSEICETIFENRFMHVPELRRMGAKIDLNGNLARICGVDGLRGAPVMATDLRASVALVLAGLAADGQTRINRVYHLDRGYEAVEVKLAACGADIRRNSS